MQAAELSIINTGEYPIIEDEFGCQPRSFAGVPRPPAPVQPYKNIDCLIRF